MQGDDNDVYDNIIVTLQLSVLCYVVSYFLLRVVWRTVIPPLLPCQKSHWTRFNYYHPPCHFSYMSGVFDCYETWLSRHDHEDPRNVISCSQDDKMLGRWITHYYYASLTCNHLRYNETSSLVICGQCWIGLCQKQPLRKRGPYVEAHEDVNFIDEYGDSTDYR